MNQLVSHPLGHYRFLPGIAPYSCGVIADPGHEIVRVTLQAPRPWRNGFERVDRFLVDHGLHRTDLCAMELRSPRPFTMQGFIEFNRGYCDVLEEWKVFVDGVNPIARTNVCPVFPDSSEPVLHAFSLVRPNPAVSQQTFVVAGAGELVEGTLAADGILHCGDTSPAAILEKAGYVCDVMADRLRGLGVDSKEVTDIQVYTVHSIHPLLGSLLLDRLPAAKREGVCWHYTRPPIIDIEFEMDVRGVLSQMRV